MLFLAAGFALLEAYIFQHLVLLYTTCWNPLTIKIQFTQFVLHLKIFWKSLESQLLHVYKIAQS